MRALVVSGTDTGIGKTVVAAMLTLALDGVYWKPIQSGALDGTDTKTVAALTGLSASHFRAERYVLREVLSPHRAAELDHVAIEPAKLALPRDVPGDRWLIVESAGGVLVPITRSLLQGELFARWGAPIVLCARTSLGTINHTLLSIEALRARGLRLAGIVFVGKQNDDNERTIAEFSGVRRLGRLPPLKTLNRETLLAAFASHFDRNAFEAADGG